MQEREFENAPLRFGTNLGLILEYFDMYKNDPDSVSDEMKYLFDNISTDQEGNTRQDGKQLSAAGQDKIKGILQWLNDVRQYGHLKADVYPVYAPEIDNAPDFDFNAYGFQDADLEALPASIVSEAMADKFDNALDAARYLEQVYTSPLSYEYTHINNSEEREWLQNAIESEGEVNLSEEEKLHLFKELVKTEGFEKYLHKNFVGAKRFSIEGVDSLVPMLDHLLQRMADENIPHLQIGMAHRGRLNVLTHTLQKPYAMMLSEFMSTDPMKFLPEDGSLELTNGWMGDVKYHLGGVKTRTDKGITQTVTLANNPSHLEIVGPVVQGRTRAQQDSTNQSGKAVHDTDNSLGVIIHGDAAFPGQGVNPESMNLSNLAGYTVGGALHIITNNRIGFTTEEWDARSTLYASDIAKGFDMPVFHVNADRPEYVLRVIDIAIQYRQKFKKDLVIDLIGYRRYGHNEMDEPMTTNPKLYNEVHEYPTIDNLYGDQLVEEGVLTKEDKESIMQAIQDELRAEHDKINKDDTIVTKDIKTPDEILEGQSNDQETEISRERLAKINEELLTYPEDFKPLKKLGNVLDRRKKPFEDDTALVDWAHAEALAFATINQDGTPIRFTGEDAERGTFAQRHAVLHDPETGKRHTPLHNISDSKASFELYNSPLTEMAVVAYEYGYNVENNEAMAIWEAQYGDFSNMAQAIFDVFMSSAHSKWGERTALTLLLPHAQEGQGPEHSSARLEKYLQLCAENNMTVVNLSSSANYFHILRRQAKYLNTEKMRPLVVMSPKSLLRNSTASQPVSEFVNGQFKEIIVPEYKKTKVKTVVIASGKVAVDILEAEAKNESPNDELLIIRLEQLYPFPSEAIKEVLSGLTNLSEVRFVQEEPQNQGAYHFVLPYLLDIVPSKATLNYVGRKPSASTAEGNGGSYKLVQQSIIENALK
ncbi:2-oxoglutarate dehydrogenase E1 component [Jeotgalicoccus sp. ATCC 8456]|uniref:2-oxoglutarate dehydrogenase E1 component n=1 Tax=Jeotgalicoccus sp. ATCC 8456 TaxID=946435 RepID=UPI0018E65922|nr:2-oxoglutarate dehydrogenase E1 component [Jeotgalicoccus sp. ATCC 8456]QQD85374.1 2-oxoglutarate dehydrogenase E1 component [Jeotgalicoccus sp. ATCC 8456]